MTRLTRPVRLTATAAASLAALGALSGCAGEAPAQVGVEESAGAEGHTDTGATSSTNQDAGADGASDSGSGSGSASGGEGDGDAGTELGSGADATSGTDPAAGTAGNAGASPYSDGTYTATGVYVSPGGRQSVEVTLTLASGVVTDAEVTPGAQDPRSLGFQEKFASGIADVVVGVPLDELDVDKVAGSSLTSEGFAVAAAAIRSEALD